MSQSDTSAIHPLDFFKPEWTVTRQSIYTDSLIVEHSLQSADEIECPATTHHQLILLLNNGTRQITRIGDQSYEGPADAGYFFLYPANYPAFFSWNSTDECVAIIIDQDFLVRTAAATECLNSDKVALKPVVVGRDPILSKIAHAFHQEMQNNALGGRLFCEALATQLAIHLLRHYCTVPAQLKQYSNGLPRTQLQTVINYVEDCLETNISINDLAQVSGLSPHYFCSVFKQTTGVAPYQYVIQQRVKKAKQLLKQRDFSIAEVALICGFANQSALNRTFKKNVGTTPRQYRIQF